MSKQHQQVNPGPNGQHGVAQAPDAGAGARGDRVVGPHGVVSTKENHKDERHDPVRLERQRSVEARRDETAKDFEDNKPKSHVDWHRKVAKHRTSRQRDLKG